MTPPQRPLSLRAYRTLTGLSAPALDALLARRVHMGKEDKSRLSERKGHATQPRPTGFLVWIHAVSVGEANSVLALIASLLARDSKLSVLLTTGTLTAAKLMAERLTAPRAIHQFAPLDHPQWVKRFFDHWRPDLGLMTESELWPNLLFEARRRSLPLLLINARISERTARRWLKHPKTIGALLRSFRLCLAQDADSAARLQALGAIHVETLGNLKFAAQPLPDNADARYALEDALTGRPRWLAASTHPGEEELVAEAHRLLRQDVPNLVTFIAPRHPERGSAIVRELSRLEFHAVRRAHIAPLTGRTEIYVADTLGELGLFYRLAPIVFIGGTLTPQGGHNPLEPASLGCALLHGPSTENFADIFARFQAHAASEEISDPKSLAAAVLRLLRDEPLRAARGQAAQAVARAEAGVLDRVTARLAPFLPDRDMDCHART